MKCASPGGAHENYQAHLATGPPKDRHEDRTWGFKKLWRNQSNGPIYSAGYQLATEGFKWAHCQARRMVRPITSCQISMSTCQISISVSTPNSFHVSHFLLCLSHQKNSHKITHTPLSQTPPETFRRHFNFYSTTSQTKPKP